MSETIPEKKTSDTRIPRLAVGCRVRTVSPDEAMLLVPEGALRLKGAASEIIGLIDGQRSVEAITTELQQKHAATDSSQTSCGLLKFIYLQSAENKRPAHS